MNLRYTTQELYAKGVHIMATLLAVLSCVYVAVLLSLVFSVIERKENISQTKDLASDLSALQAQYANVVSSITDNDLVSYGFSRVDGTTFAVRKDAIASYTVLYAH